MFPILKKQFKGYFTLNWSPIQYFIFLSPFVFFTPGCTPQYGSGNPFGDKIYFEKIGGNSYQKTNFIGGNFYHSMDSSSASRKEKNYSYDLYYGQSYVFNMMQTSFGIFGYKGSYKVNLPDHKSWKPYYGTGFSFETAINDFNLAYLNNFTCMKATLNYEDGAYYRFRKEAEKQNVIFNLNPGKYSLNLSIGNDFIFSKNDKSIGFYVSGGSTFDLSTRRKVLILCTNLHVSLNSNTFYIQYSLSNFFLSKTLWFGYNISFKH